MEAEKPKHAGYAGGSSSLDRATVEAAILRLINDVTTTTEKQKDGSLVTKTSHETDPPENFIERRSLKRPGPLPALLDPSLIAKGSKVIEHEHEAFVDPEHDLDVWAFGLARWAVLEARRLRARSIVVRSADHDETSARIKVAFVL